jgi:hypothetical protein
MRTLDSGKEGAERTMITLNWSEFQELTANDDQDRERIYIRPIPDRGRHQRRLTTCRGCDWVVDEAFMSPRGLCPRCERAAR